LRGEGGTVAGYKAFRKESSAGLENGTCLLLGIQEEEKRSGSLRERNSRRSLGNRGSGKKSQSQFSIP